MPKDNIQKYQDDATAHNEEQLSKAIKSQSNAEGHTSTNEGNTAKRKMRDWRY